MIITLEKKIRFKLEDVLSINELMEEKGTLYAEALITYEEDTYDSEYLACYGSYSFWWKAFSGEDTIEVSISQRCAVFDLLALSYYKDVDAFLLSEEVCYDLSSIWEHSLLAILSQKGG